MEKEHDVCPLWQIYLKGNKTTKLVPMGVWRSQEFVSMHHSNVVSPPQGAHACKRILNLSLIWTLYYVHFVMYLGCTALGMLVCMYPMCCILYET